jgi:hypothetical protein
MAGEDLGRIFKMVLQHPRDNAHPESQASGQQPTHKELQQFRKNVMSQFKYLKHDDVIARTGGSAGAFQVLSFTVCLIVFSTEAFLIYNLAFLNLQPVYSCMSGDRLLTPCPRQATCSAQYNHRIDFNSAPGTNEHGFFVAQD